MRKQNRFLFKQRKTLWSRQISWSSFTTTIHRLRWLEGLIPSGGFPTARFSLSWPTCFCAVFSYWLSIVWHHAEPVLPLVFIGSSLSHKLWYPKSLTICQDPNNRGRTWNRDRHSRNRVLKKRRTPSVLVVWQRDSTKCFQWQEESTAITGAPVVGLASYLAALLMRKNVFRE